ncbi:NAD-dependent epimerase/dehydratase family protein [Streptomyces incanus]|uniref:NAD-dependent epimerase/dehydratase family protein n=1 Tax=Streptomyces incanus TaxID=887453 RepID=A0ABW0XUV5_9ACTN
MLPRFRARLVGNGMERVVFDRLLEYCVDAGLVAAGGKQRTDSTHVVSSVRDLNRLELAGESVRAALEALSVAAPDWLARAVDVPEFAHRYGPRVDSWKLPGSKVKRDQLSQVYGQDALRLCRAAWSPAAPAWLREIGAVDIMRQVLVQTYTVRTSSRGKNGDPVHDHAPHPTPTTPGLGLTDLPANGDTVLVAGDGGLIGSYAAREYTRLGWTVHGVSRRALDDAPWQHHSVDLLDAESATTGLAGLGDVTHLVFAAYIERPTDAELIEVNDALLRNTLDALRAAGAPLRHVTLYQGGKAYGHHLGYFTTQAKESDPRLVAPHFYSTQEDLLRQAAAERGFAFTALRPEGVTGYATGNPMNLLLVIGIHAAICKELGLPMRFPGTRAAYDVLYQTTDAELLARATVWAGSAGTAADQVFNVISARSGGQAEAGPGRPGRRPRHPGSRSPYLDTYLRPCTVDLPASPAAFTVPGARR